MKITTNKKKSVITHLRKLSKRRAKRKITLIKSYKKHSSKKFQRKFTKLKVILFTIVILLIYEYYKYSLIKEKNEENQNNDLKNYENNFFSYFKSLKNISYNNSSFLEEYRDRILKKFSQKLSKNITSLDNIYIDYFLKFGNQLVLFNKAIFYCEIIKCKKIFVHPWNNIYIRNTIYDEQFNLSIEIAKNYDDFKNKLSTYYYPYYNFLFIKPENRFPLFKN